MAKQEEELKFNVTFLQNGMPYGYAYFKGEQGYVDPNKTIEVIDEETKKPAQMNWIKWATRKGLVEAI